MIKKYHEINNIKIENGILYITVDGKHIQKDLRELSTLLAEAKEEEQKEFEVSPSGYGIHWPLIDEDISIDGLLGVVHTVNIGRKSA